MEEKKLEHPEERQEEKAGEKEAVSCDTQGLFTAV